jgi:putative aminopeptidase FrvX
MRPIENIKAENIIKGVFSHPTAPFRENWVLNHIEIELKKLRVPFFRDKWGNIIAGARGPLDLKKSQGVVLIAHTDHPGFHILKQIKPYTYRAQWLGGYPPKTKGAKVAIYHPYFPKLKISGTIISKKFSGPKKNIFTIETKETSFPLDDNCFGAFDFPGYKRKGFRIQTRAADDLAGVAIILGTFARLKSKDRKNMIGLFTRAEEVGFRGALGFLYQNLLSQKHSAISLEASRTLEGARIGLGPVIRLGDRKTLFDSAVTLRLDEAAAALQKKKKFSVQRRIMNGGTCEATAFNLHGIPCSGLAIPLGNYHNQRPNGKSGAEFIDIRDVERAIELCTEFYKRFSKNNPVAIYKKSLAKGFRSDAKYFKKKIEFAK